MKIVVLLLPLTFILASNKLEANSLFCDEEPGRDSVLQLIVDGDLENRLDFVEFDFDQKPLLAKEFACRGWTNELYDTKWYRTKNLQYKHLTPEQAGHIRVQGDLKNKLYRHCIQSNRCKLRFPYNLHMPLASIAAVFNKQPKSPNHEFCSQRAIKPTADMESFEDLQTLDIESYWMAPVEKFSDKVKKVIEQSGDSSVFVSSMTTSFNEIKLLNQYSQNKKKGNVYLLFDMNISMNEIALKHRQEETNDRIILVPMISTPSDSNTFHVKGATDVQGKNYVFTSSNLRGQSTAQTLDLGLVGSKGKFSKELASLYAHLFANNCKNVDFLKCHLEHGYAPNDKSTKIVKKLIADSCSKLAKDESLQDLLKEPYQPKYVRYSRHTDIQKTALNYLNKAKEKVTITASFVDDRKIISKLNSLKRKGLEVNVVILGERNKRLSKQISVVANTKKLKMHSKMILVDDDYLVWSTGNFTSSGLTRNREFMFTVTGKKEIELAKTFTDTLLRINSTEGLFNKKKIAPITIKNNHRYLLYGIPKQKHANLKQFRKDREDFWVTEDPRCLKKDFEKSLFVTIAEWEDSCTR